jgi:hypothetical protein
VTEDAVWGYDCVKPPPQVSQPSVIDLGDALQAEDLPCLLGRGRLDAEFVGDAHHLRHLLAVAFRHLSLVQKEVVLQAHAAVAADEQRLRAEGELGPPGHTDGKFKIADELPCIVHEKQQVFAARRDAAQNAHDKLDVNGLFDMARLDQVGHVVDHARIVDLELRLRPVLLEEPAVLAHRLEGIGENEIFGHPQVHLFPLEFPFLVSGNDGEQGKVDGSGIEGGQLRLEKRDRGHTLLHGHAHAAARGDADDDVAAAPDTGDDLLHEVCVGNGHARFGVPGMDVADRRAGFVGPHGLIGDLLRRDGQIGGHGRRVDASRDGCGDDGFVFHCCSLLL